MVRVEGAMVANDARGWEPIAGVVQSGKQGEINVAP